ncbi:unnamed protein product, partial [Mesorhabditis spiculigera]
MYNSIGTRVFPPTKPNPKTAGPNVLHYRIPPEEPPIDYTLRDKPKVRADYRVVYPVHKELPDDYFGEPTHHIHEVLENAPVLPPRKLPPMRVRRNTTEETASRVLEELDSALEEDEQLDFEQVRGKVQAMNLSFRQYPRGYDPDNYPEDPHQGVLAEEVSQRMRRLAVSPPGSTRQAPILSEYVIDDLKAIPQAARPIGAVHELNEQHRYDVETMRRRAEADILRARQVYTTEFFFDQTPEFERNSQTRVPEWKRRLIAKRMAIDAIRQHEDRVMEDFYEWKRRYEPSYRETAHFSPSASARLPR